MQTTTPRESYAAWLRRKMGERGLSVRALARAWNPEDPETARRALRRYLAGVQPIARTRGEIAEAMGSEETEPASDDEEEGDLLAVLDQRLAEMWTIVDRIRRERTHGMRRVA